MSATDLQLRTFDNVGTEIALHSLAHNLKQVVDIRPLIVAMRAA